MPERVAAVANRFLDLAEAESRPLDHMKLQKLIYFAHGLHLAIEGEPLLDEMIEAWEHGPVVSSLYHQFKLYGARPIRGRAWYIDPDLGTAVYPQTAAEHVNHLIGVIWARYGAYRGVQLSTMTHASDTPWSEIRRAMPWARNAQIPNDLIEEYFRNLAHRNRMRNEAAEASHFC
jgi:uncharacterized phage-associated protein